MSTSTYVSYFWCTTGVLTGPHSVFPQYHWGNRWRPTVSHVRRRYHRLCFGSDLWSGGFQVKWSPTTAIYVVLWELSHSPSYQDGVYAAQWMQAIDWATENKLLRWAIKFVIEEVVSTRCLAVQIDNALKWDHHVSELAKSFTHKLNLLNWLYFLPRQARTDFYFRVFLPSVTYGMLVWGSCGQVLFSNLESIHVRAARIIFDLDWCTPGTLGMMYEKRLLILAHQAYYHLLPCPTNCLFEKYVSSYDLRRKMTFKLPRPKTDMVRKSCSYKSIIRWNALENQMRLIHDIDAFKSHSSVFLSHIYYNDALCRIFIVVNT